MAGEKKGGGTLGVSILTRGGHRFPAGRLGPPSNPPRELAAAARYLIRLQEPSHGLSGENEPQFPIFPAKRGSATSPATENREIVGVLERGAMHRAAPVAREKGVGA